MRSLQEKLGELHCWLARVCKDSLLSLAFFSTVTSWHRSWQYMTSKSWFFFTVILVLGTIKENVVLQSVCIGTFLYAFATWDAMGWREIELDGWIHTSSSGQLMTVCSFDRHLNLSMLFYVMGSGLKCNWMAQKSWRPPAPWSAWKCFDESQYSVFHHTATLSVGMVLIVRMAMTMMMTIGWWGVGGGQMAITMLIVMIMVMMIIIMMMVMMVLGAN